MLPSVCLTYSTSLFVPLGPWDTQLQKDTLIAAQLHFSKNTIPFYKKAENCWGAHADRRLSLLAGYVRLSSRTCAAFRMQTYTTKLQKSFQVHLWKLHQCFLAKGLWQDAWQSNHCIQRLGRERPKFGRSCLIYASWNTYSQKSRDS